MSTSVHIVAACPLPLSVLGHASALRVRLGATRDFQQSAVRIYQRYFYMHPTTSTPPTITPTTPLLGARR
jgi:hypothetical protein